jgi:metal-sulfur cluster biosynthetic enzyme
MNLVDTDAIWQALASIPDPEFGISIVDLGLIYSVECTDGNARVVMTLTTPSCPSGGWMQEGAQAAVERVPGVSCARVEMTFEPRWNPEMLSATARRQLGWSSETQPA